MGSRSFIISRSEAGQQLATVVRRYLAVPWAEANRLVRDRRVWLAGATCNDPTHVVQRGQRVRVRLDIPKKAQPPRRRRAANYGEHSAMPGAPQPRIQFVDNHVVVVDKPHGLTTMRHADEAAEFGARAQRFLPATLADLLPELLAQRGLPNPRWLRAVHRLDRDTSGLVVFARSAAAESHLGKLFRAHAVERTYLALVRDKATSGRIESFLVQDRGDGRRGSSLERGQGKRAVTHVRLVEQLGEFSLVECRLETGRTHQVRIHLAEAGTPLCGEQVYDRPLHGRPVPDASGAKRPMLHAATLAFEHPATGKRMSWRAPLPPDMAKLLKKLRASP